MARDVQVDSDSMLAYYADWRSRIARRQIAALGQPGRPDAVYVADEVIVDGDDRELVDELVGRYGGEVVPDADLPVRPEAFRNRRERDVIDLDAPVAVRVRFERTPMVEGYDDVLRRALSDDDGLVLATSELGVGVAALAARYALEDRPIGLNLLGEPLAMPISTATEGSVPGIGSNPFSWAPFAGRTRMVQAWQLMDSIRDVRSGDPFVVLAVLDNGFWLDSNGTPFVSAGQPVSDLGAGVMQLNLMAEGTPAGGPTGKGMAWHGNAVASVAAGTLNNSAGVAGAGGSVATPMLFRTDISVDQILRCVRICAAWGIDVLNMSIGTWGQTELFFPTSTWNKTFQFAADNDVVMIAAAGNDNLDLPDDRNIRPATRTPGVLTIGALDATDNKWSSSNHGSSLNLWAPGTAIPVAPDQANPQGSQPNGTSFAAPMVAGVAAMMRSADTSLTAHDIRRILVETGWNGSGPVGKGLDALAALLSAVHRTLPDNAEPNNTPAAARALIPTGPNGALQPGLGPFTSRSSPGDVDFWSFTVDRFSTVTVNVDWYERLSTLLLDVEAESPDARAPDLARSGSSSSGHVTLKGLLAPGRYRIRVGGSGLTAYALQVRRTAASLPVDQFEWNDSFETASRMRFEASKWGPFALSTWGPGTFDATLHVQRLLSPYIGGGSAIQVMNKDYFRLDVPDRKIFSYPAVAVFDSDELIDVTLYDDRRQVIERRTDVRSVTLRPPLSSVCYLEVSGAKPTRYRISTTMKVDSKLIPGPLEEYEFFPPWWHDPGPLRLIDEVTHYLHEVTHAADQGPAIVLEAPADGVLVELLDREGIVVRGAEARDGQIELDTRDLEAGPYVVRFTRTGDLAVPAEVTQLPPLGLADRGRVRVPIG